MAVAGARAGVGTNTAMGSIRQQRMRPVRGRGGVHGEGEGRHADAARHMSVASTLAAASAEVSGIAKMAKMAVEGGAAVAWRGARRGELASQAIGHVRRRRRLEQVRPLRLRGAGKSALTKETLREAPLPPIKEEWGGVEEEVM